MIGISSLLVALTYARFALAYPFHTIETRASSVTAIGPVADLHIINGDVSPDGFNRTAVLASADGNANGAVGPLITANSGDTLQLNVINSLNNATFLQSTSIHWHGLFQQRTNYMDGPAFVTQCPIAKNNSFLYEFSTGSQAGTYWYHSHLSTQYCDGLRGPLVIYDPSDPNASLYDVDDETTVITLSDWYHSSARALAGTIPTPDAMLINGLGRSYTDPTSDLAVISVESGKRYRFRMVNMACDPNYTFSIDNHTFTVIEADGVNHEPVVADSIQIFVGQRYSFVLEANQTVGNYWIRANPNGARAGFTDNVNMAILRYVGATVEDPTTTQDSSNLLLETSLHPLTNPGAPGNPVAGGVDNATNLALAFDATSFTFSVNGVTFTPPTTPVLLQILSGAQTADNLLPSGSVYPLPANATVELSIPGGVAGSPHPFHLHGHTFDVVRSAGSSDYNYVNPVRRDVVSIGNTGDNVTIRFTTDNVGPWFLHCHIDWHLEIGLAIVFAEDTGDWASDLTPPSAWDQLCPTYDSLASSDL